MYEDFGQLELLVSLFEDGIFAFLAWGGLVEVLSGFRLEFTGGWGFVLLLLGLR